ETFYIHRKQSGQCDCQFRLTADSEGYQVADPIINRDAFRVIADTGQIVRIVDGIVSQLLWWIERTARPTKRTDWQNIQPLPDQKTRLNVQIVITGDQYEKLRWGYIPRAMEDHWFYFMEDDCLYLHRSWTGFCIFQVTFAPADDGYKAVEIWANRDPDQYQGDADYDRDWLTGFLQRIANS
ncbi:MAG: hypothetical protein JXA10_18070, partial [Anaerolineae bacterium]|nr:hypothetical protein [Anaerolineae bacterium]